MACTVNILNLLGATQGGGTLSGNLVPTTGATTSLFANNGQGWISTGNVLDDTFNADNQIPGTYTFTYNIGTGVCAAQSILTINVSSSPSCGTSITLNPCMGAPIINLWNAIGGTPLPSSVTSSGMWSGSNGSFYTIGSNAPLTNTFNPSTIGSYVYTYSAGTLNPICADCQCESTVTINVLASPIAGNNATISLCN